MKHTKYDEVHIVRDGLEYQLIVNGANAGESCCINDLELVKALSSSGNFYPFTCSCSIPECAGLHEPIHCQKSLHTMIWHKKYPAPEEIFTFEPEKVLSELEQVLNVIYGELFDQFKNKPHQTDDFPHGPYGSTLATLLQALELCRKELHFCQQQENRAVTLSHAAPDHGDARKACKDRIVPTASGKIISVPAAIIPPPQ